MKKFIWIFLIAAVWARLSDAEESRRLLGKGTGVEKSIEHDGVERTYRIHVPDRAGDKHPVPLLFVFHGGGGNSRQASRMGFTKLADRERLIVIYPEGLDGHWSDGRSEGVVAEKVADNDDVGFVAALVDATKKDFKIDAGRIYATGASNGGMMSHRVGIERADLFVGIAPMIGGIPVEMATKEKFRPSEPVSVLIIQGTEDPFVPYGGGKVEPKLFPKLRAPTKNRGEIVATEKAIELWREANGIPDKPDVVKLPDFNTSDDSTLVVTSYPEGRGGSKLKLVQMVGAGHTILGGAQYLPESVIGKTCRDADAVEMIWEFFEEVRR